MYHQIIQIEFRGVIVGLVKSLTPDQWQIEGEWHGNGHHLASVFEAEAAKATENAPEGENTSRLIRCISPKDKPYMAYIVGLNENRLSIRKFASLVDSNEAKEKYMNSSSSE